ncbi:helix-turn-helix domain-containing protein [Nocardioides sp.]|uniref:helix-turn-helix domain-containing protein n=1 Tax=Nocardioides sp. TaxID=35761 RepID=UPI0025F483C5|nr:helix-turn-helix domain-containing protein [Nocardioides sp.]
MSILSTDLQETSGAERAPVEVRVDARLAAPVGGLAALVAIAYLSRAIGGGGWLDWVLALVTGAIAAAHLQSLVDARVPLLVVDEQGVRLRRRGTWHGLPWDDIECLEHEPRRGMLHDGRLVLVPRDADAPVLSVPLSLSTRVVGAEEGLTEALADLAPHSDQVVETGPDVALDAPADDTSDAWDDQADDALDAWEDEPTDEHTEDDEPARHDDEPHHPVLHDPRPALARGIGFLAARLRLTPGVPAGDDAPALDPGPEPTVALPMVASATPLPLRDPVTATRAEVRFEGAAALAADPADDDAATSTWLPEAAELRRGDHLVIDDLAVDAAFAVEPALEPALDPVIGPELAAARSRLALSVDQLAERTRIRPHVIESIEVDDFAPCGGDFYARGHLRTLARVLGVDAAPLLTAYDERYADAPIDARRVFESELATGVDGPIRSTRGGPNWSVLVAAVMAIVLAWSIARLVMDSPVSLDHKPVLNGSPSSAAKVGPPVPVVLTAAAGGAHVKVFDATGEVVFAGDLAFGDSKTLKASPPVRVQSSDGALQVRIDGRDRGALGEEGQPAQNTFAASTD